MANDLNGVKQDLYDLFNGAVNLAKTNGEVYGARTRQKYLDQACQATDKIIQVEEAQARIETMSSGKLPAKLQTGPER